MLNKNLKKLLATILCATLGMSMLAGCGAEQEKNEEQSTESKSVENEQESAEGSDEVVTLKVWIPDNLRVEDYNTNYQTVWLEENGGFDLEIEPIPAEDYLTKVNMALTAGNVEELPDVILHGNFGSGYINAWAEAGTILPLTDYIYNPDKAVHITQNIEKLGTDYPRMIASADGEIYAIPGLNMSYGNEFQAKMWIYEPWLEALDAEVPTTIEEYFTLLKQVVETDLNGNGKKDEIGVLGNSGVQGLFLFHYLMNPFVYAGDSNYLEVEDGVVSAAYTTEEWKEGLSWYKKLFDEGLTIQETLTMDDAQFNTLMSTEEPIVFSLVYPIPLGSRQADYICIDTLTGPNGVNYSTYRPSVPFEAMVITSNCKNVEAAFQLGDLMSSEHIGITSRWGEEGKDWDYADKIENPADYKPSIDGFDLSIIVYDDANYWGGSEPTNGSWYQQGVYVRGYWPVGGMAVLAEGTDQYTARVNAAYTLYQEANHEPDEVIPKLNFSAEENEAVSEIKGNLLSYVDKFKADVAVGAVDLEDEWDNYLAELDKIGLEEYLDVVQVVYDRMYK